MWVKFVVGSCRCSESFSLGPPVFLPPQEQTFLIPVETVERRATSWNVYCWNGFYWYHFTKCRFDYYFIHHFRREEVIVVFYPIYL